MCGRTCISANDDGGKIVCVSNACSTIVQVGQRPESKARECILFSIQSSFEKGLALCFNSS